ncbi:MAG: FkbM family methyltransferase [Pseudomonadota bacterium]
MTLAEPAPLKPWMRKEIRAAADGNAGSEEGTLTALAELSRGHKNYFDTDFVLANQVIVRQAGRDMHFPRPLNRENHRTILTGYLEVLHGKYQKPGFCEVRPGDTVIDCGAYVGGFARSVAPIAGRLVLIEPAPANLGCCIANLSAFAHARVVQAGLFNTSGTFELQLSDRDVDHSLLAPDRGATGETLTVPTYRLEDLATSLGLDQIDFFKLEAEGAEIEAIDGMGPLRPRNIAIDAGPERYGESPAPELTRMLIARGYEVAQTGNTLFARLVA